MVPIDARRRIATDFLTRSALTLALLASLPSVVGAAAAPARSTLRSAERPGVADVRVARDPETGGWTLAPFSAGAVTLDRAASPDAQMAMNQSLEGLDAEAQPDGSWLLDVQGRFQNYSIARKDVTGALHFDCGQDPLNLFEWLTTTPEPVDAFGRPVR